MFVEKHYFSLCLNVFLKKQQSIVRLKLVFNAVKMSFQYLSGYFVVHGETLPSNVTTYKTFNIPKPTSQEKIVIE